jgi:hypothetical protein
MSVRRAQEEISSREFSEWLAYRRIRHDPEDVRIARVCTVMARLAGNKRVKLKDFLPRLPAASKQSQQQLKAGLMAYGEMRKAREAERAAKRQRTREEARRKAALRGRD